MKSLTSFQSLRKNLENGYLHCPRVVSAQFLNNKYFRLVQQKTDPKLKKNRILEETYQIDENSLKRIPGTTYRDPEILLNEISPDQTYNIILRKSEAENVFNLEIIKSDIHIKTFKLAKVHKSPCFSPMLISKPIIWNKDCTKFLYLAERWHESKEIWGEEDESNQLGDDAEAYLETHAYKPNYGEGLLGFTHLDIFIVDLKELQVQRVKNLEKMIQFPSFSGEDDSSLIFCSLEEEIMRGVYVSSNRKSKIWLLKDYEWEVKIPAPKDEKKDSKEKEEKEKEKKKAEKEKYNLNLKEISQEEDFINLFPMISPDGSKVAYQFSSSNNAHLLHTGLKVYDIKQNSWKKLTDYKETESELPIATYAGHISYPYLWTEDDQLYFFSTQKAAAIINKWDISTGERKIASLPHEFKEEAVSVLSITSNRQLLMNRINPLSRYNLELIQDINDLFTSKSPKSISLDIKESPEIERGNLEKGFGYYLPKENFEEERLCIEGINTRIWRTKSDLKELERPTLIFLHGGPHTFSSTDFRIPLNILMNCGYQVVTIEYSGSFSYGKEFNERACGKIGDLDYKEITGTIQNLIENKRINPETLDYFGWSYSGYLGAVLLQKSPQIFRRVLIGNPVVNLFSTLFSSDIPEWVTTEGLGEIGELFSFGREFSDENILKLKQHSPALHPPVDKITSKVLFIIGENDRRAPPHGTYFYYKKLKNLGVDVRLLNYEGSGHGVAEPDKSFDVWLNILHHYLKPNGN